MARRGPAAVPVAAALAIAVTTASGAGGEREAPSLAPYRTSGDAIAAPLGGLAGDAARGRAIVLDRALGN